MKEIHSSEIFDGPDWKKSLSCNSKALYNGMYKQVGRMIAVCLIHGGVEPNFFSERLFLQVCNLKPSAPDIEEIVDFEFREKIKAIQSAQNVEDARNAITEAADELAMLGSLRHINTLEDRDDMVVAATNFLLESRLRDSVQQFKEGLECLQLLQHLEQHPSLFREILMFKEKPLTAKDLAELFIPQLSPVGTNKRTLENRIVCFWRHWLLDVEGNIQLVISEVFNLVPGIL
ncbi:G2/M phase-specific E3 ubiquitin-protein ligase-like [Danio rerio]|uniref:G2/M phase-specific E3 ubiquitin-protein ligase-like n=1 Tax=Danio rerio TaxID=7955 RepID=A0AC58JF30_DANRE